MTVPERSAGRTFPALDSLRAVGAFAVLATHTSFQAGLYDESLSGTALSRLDVGVAIFFVLSGFLLSRPYLRGRASSWSRAGLARYATRRAARILPVYVVTVVMALVLLPQNSGAGAGTWLRNLTLTDLYASDHLPQGLTQMWSLTTEVAFYAVLPLLMLVVAGTRPTPARTLAGVTAMVVITIVWISDAGSIVSDVTGSATVFQWLPAYLSWFAVGLLLAVAETRRESTSEEERPTWVRVLADVGRSPGACWTTALALFAVACTPIGGPALLLTPTTGQTLTKNLLYAVIAGFIVLAGIHVDPQRGTGRLMAWQPFRHLGHISFSVFCCHLLVIEWVMRWRDIPLFSGRGWELFTLTLLGSVLMAEVLYRLVERPVLAVAHRRGPGAEPPSRSRATLRTTST